MKQNYTNIFIDLDGTIIDSAPGVKNGVVLALKHFNITPDPTSLTRYIGPPLIQSFQKFHGLSLKDAEKAVDIFRENYLNGGMWDADLYPGIADLIKDLHAAGKKVILATSKGEEPAVAIIKHYKLDQYFSFMGGADIKNNLLTKAEVLQNIKRRGGVDNFDDGIMVGDTTYDVEGAHTVGLPCACVLYGFGTKEELVKAKCDFIINDMVALRDFLLPNN